MVIMIIDGSVTPHIHWIQLKPKLKAEWILAEIVLNQNSLLNR